MCSPWRNDFSRVRGKIYPNHIDKTHVRGNTATNTKKYVPQDTIDYCFGSTVTAIYHVLQFKVWLIYCGVDVTGKSLKIVVGVISRFQNEKLFEPPIHICGSVCYLTYWLCLFVDSKKLLSYVNLVCCHIPLRNLFVAFPLLYWPFMILLYWNHNSLFPKISIAIINF